MRFEMFLLHPLVQALGSSLLHFLWQGALLALGLWVFLLIAPASAARARYAAAAIALFLMPVMLAITLMREFPAQGPLTKLAPLALAGSSLPLGTLFVAPAAPAHTNIGIPGWSVGLWLMGVLLLSVRSLGGWMRAQRLRRRVTGAASDLEPMLGELTRRLRISAPVRLCTSALVEVPTVIGWLRPYILLPITALTGLNDSQIAAILAHELAHIRRQDYLVNLLQTAVETVFFYHPCVWWVSKQMRTEREHCCDDIAVALCGSPSEYAAALAELEHIRSGNLQPALAATGGDLLARIRRVLGQPPTQSRASTSLGTLAAAIVVLSFAFAPAVHSQGPAPAPSPARPKPPAAVAPAPASAAPKPQPRPAPAEPREFEPGILADSIRIPDIQDALAQARLQMGQVNGLLADNAPARTPEERTKTVDLLIRLYDSEKSADMKASILSYLAIEDDKRASDKLLSIAQSDPNADMRMTALSFIARNQNSFDTLSALYDSQTDNDMRIALLSYIGLSNDPRATDKLMSIVQSNAPDDVRQAALSLLVRR